MPKKINYRFAVIFLSVLLVFNFLPLVLLAEGLVPCGQNVRDDAGNIISYGKPTDCKWKDLVTLFNNIIDFIFKDLMIPLAVVAIVYAGIQVLIHQDNPGELKKAYGTLQKVGIGIFLALGAYAIVKTIATMLANPDSIFQKAIDQVF